MLLLPGFDARATTRTWNGSSSASWNTAANWINNAVPVDGDDLLFPLGAANKANNNNIASLSVRSITFTDSGYACIGNSVTLTGTNGISANQSSGSIAISLPFFLATNVTITVVSSAASLGISGTITLNGRLLTTSGSGFCNFSGSLSGAGGSFAKLGSGTNRLSGLIANSFIGGASVSAGTLELGKTGSLNSMASDLVIGAGATVRYLTAQGIADFAFVSVTGTLDLNGFSDTIGPLTLTGGQVMTGAGTLTLNGDVTANSSTNPATISGNLSLGSATRSFSVAAGSANPDLTISAVISGNAGVGLTKEGLGTLRLSGTNTYSGLTTVKASFLDVANPFALGSTSSGTTLSGGTLFLADVTVAGETLTNDSLTAFQSVGAAGWSGDIVLNSTLQAQVISGTNNLSGVISGAGGLIKTHSGALTLSGTNNNTYSGTTMVNEGSLLLHKSASTTAVPGPLIVGDGVGAVNADVVRLEANQQISDSANITITNSGLFDANGFTEIVGPVSGQGNLQLDASIFSVSVPSGTTTPFDGTVSGSVSLVKIGGGVWELTGTNTYSGSVSLAGGTLLVNGTLPANLISVSGTLGGTGTVGRVSVAGGGTISPGLSPGRLTTSNLSFTVTSKFRAELNGTTPGSGYDQLKVNGTVNNLASATLNATLGFASGIGNSFTIIDNDGTEAVTNTFLGLPEGATLNLSGTPFVISYVGGSGNDVVLTQLTATQQPVLNLSLFGTNRAVLSWATNFTGFTLEANTNVNATIWASVPDVPAISGTNNVVTNLVSGLENYYRLRGP